MRRARENTFNFNCLWTFIYFFCFHFHRRFHFAGYRSRNISSSRLQIFINDSSSALLQPHERRHLSQKTFEIQSESCWCHERKVVMLLLHHQNTSEEILPRGKTKARWIFYAVNARIAMNDAKGGSTCPRSNLFSDSVILLKWIHQKQAAAPFIHS